MTGHNNTDVSRPKPNPARFFIRNQQIAWVLLAGIVLWGTYGYIHMPKRKDPNIQIRMAVAIDIWPGVKAEKIEQLVTRKIEEKMAQNARVDRTESITRDSVSIVYVRLDDQVTEVGKEFDDIKQKLDSIQDLPDGAQPIQFIKDFGDTAALMLTVASPRVSPLEVELRVRAIEQAIRSVRHEIHSSGQESPFTIIYAFPESVSPQLVRRPLEIFAQSAEAQGTMRNLHTIAGSGFIGLDGTTSRTDAELMSLVDRFIRDRLVASEFPPDAWAPAIIRDPAETATKLEKVAGAKYSYRELDDFTDLIQRTMQTVPEVSKVDRSGVLAEQVFLDYSQDRLASYDLQPSLLRQILTARNITLPGGVMEAGGKNLNIDPTGEFRNEKEIGDVLVAASPSGSPVYLRDLVDIARGYESPPRFLNFYSWRDPAGNWQRGRAVTVAIQMRPGEQIGHFGEEVDKALSGLRQRLPEDLVIARTSDQPRQVRENVSLFMTSLYEAIALVVLVALVGFWEWRAALLMAISIPLTLFMTFGIINVLGIDLQMVSIGTLIIALGLLVDMPVVAGDAIKRDLAAGETRSVAAWLGPARLARAIFFATVTNIVAYLPFLMLTGDKGHFLYSLPVVMTSCLVASFFVAMTFIPLMAYYLLRAPRKPELPIEQRRTRGFSGFYYRAGSYALQHRWKVLGFSLIFLGLGAFFLVRVRTQFFPKDLSYLSYVDVWLPEDAPLSATNLTAMEAEETIRQTAEQYGREHPDREGRPRRILQSLTTFVGGGGPRFWFSVAPELKQLNYAQIVIEVTDKHDTSQLVGPFQHALSADVPGARIDVRQLETAVPVGIPVSIRISGDDIPTLRRLSSELQQILNAIPSADRVRDDWDEEAFLVKLAVDPDRANLVGISNLDVAASSASAMNGFPVTTLREGDKQIPVVARLRMEERARLGDIRNLYVYSLAGRQKVPLGLISSISYSKETQQIRRRNQFRTVTVACFPVPGVLPSEIMNQVRPKLAAFERSLPPGFRMEVGGEEEEQVKGFRELSVVMAVSVAAIFLALVIQFRSAVKPLLVFGAIPYGMVGSLILLSIMQAPFGFMAFLGVASLVGVIVSHVIVLFDFIEAARERGEPLRQALLDAGILRLRPVLITVGATVLGLFPLALHGGPFWQSLCYAQIGGLSVATFVTLFLVPVLYSIFVLDLKIVSWKPSNREDISDESGSHALASKEELYVR